MIEILFILTYKTSDYKQTSKNRHIRYDTTLPRTNKIKCVNNECISHKETDKNEIVLYTIKYNQELKFICINCNSEWK